ncbi:hypothetical protein BOH66_06490 [Microbacterium aurum]|uniref:Uncharacterized protein n=1 Tax=Microbacterium aurum TaxID=36805 RepID=A0A1P8UC99_9MICO|nr:hypothetical protein [Microbacterium aurum]APZ35776.1 hypothetical protein BOH66_06490 [Microbacterium aurum]MBM7827711.1 hypothetical protein [Microbacterium aurum]
MSSEDEPSIFFSAYFGVHREELDAYGAFDLNLLADVPLFVDPFLLFNSAKPAYQELHEGILTYLRYLKSLSGEELSDATIRDLFRFQEVRQNWFGYCELGNRGQGLGTDFARALRLSVGRVVANEGESTSTASSHLEKVSLIQRRVGLDKISDFTTNLIKDFLVEYTETFARDHISDDRCADVMVKRIRFSPVTQTWVDEIHRLPMFEDDYVLLTPTDMLVHEDTWINYSDMVARYPEIAAAVDDDVLRDKMNRYFYGALGDSVKKSDVDAARAHTLQSLPELIDIYIKLKEDSAEGAVAVSTEELARLRAVFVEHFSDVLRGFLAEPELAGRPSMTSFDEAKFRCAVFKRWVENKEGWKSLNSAKGHASEAEVQRLIFLALQASEFDVNREVNNGQGPVDFKLSAGATDSALIEVKLASNTSLRRNLENQVEVYKKANETKFAVKLIVFYTEAEKTKVEKILKDLDVAETEWIVLVDARSDNKPTGSMA